MRQRSVFYVLMALFVVGVLAACGAQPEPTPTAEPTEDPTPQIALVVGVGGLDDDSFNELAYSGMQAATGRRGLSFDVVEAPELSAYEETVRDVASENYDVIFTVSFPMTEPTQSVAADFPETQFVGIDQFYQEPDDNLTGITFPEQDAGYLAGVLAGRMTETDIVGAVLGPDDVAPVVRFANGYEQGVQSVSSDIEVMIEFHPGTVDNGFTDPVWGQEQVAEQIRAGADVIFGAGGETGNGALTEVANRALDGETLYCIGVDTDQWESVPDARPCLLTSAVKDIPVAIDQVLEQVLNENAPEGNYVGPAGLAPFHDFADVIPQDVQVELEQIAADLRSGELEVGDAEDAETD